MQPDGGGAPRAPRLIAYAIDGQPIGIRPAPVDRDWMDHTNQRFAYRCLPLNIANAYGWELLCPSGFLAVWNGEDGLAAISIVSDSDVPAPAVSHFGRGVLTFHVPCLFRTEPGFDLMVQGPINRPKDAIAALTGVIETDWSPYSFTMNWLFTRPGTPIRFEEGEPYCHVFPVRRVDIETVVPEVHPLSNEPALKAQYESWTVSRKHFNAELLRPGSDAEAEKWQKMYHRGVTPESDLLASQAHRIRLRLKPFAKTGDDRTPPTLDRLRV
jgi:Family of unknown function (DUF6065)